MLDLLFPKQRASTLSTDSAAGWETFLSGGFFGGWKTQAGVSVTEDTALTYAPWWCGCRILCEAVMSLPYFTFQRKGEDREHATTLPLYDLLWRAPNPDMPSGPWREGRMLHQINYGNGFSEIQWDSMNPARRTQPVALWPIHASRVYAVEERGQDAEDYAAGYRYKVRNDDRSYTLLKADEMLHVPGIFPEDGIWGKSAVEYGKETIGFGLAVERFGATSFGSGGMPRAAISGHGMRNPEARAEFRKNWKEWHGDPAKGEIALVPDGAKLEFFTHMTHENAQFLESRAFNKRQVAAILRVPLYMMEESEAAPGGVVEQKSLEFVIYSLLPWLRRWEEQCNLKLFLPSQRASYFCEFELKGLLRGAFSTRMTAYIQALQNGILTLNEIRRLENLPGIGPDGDVHYAPANAQTIEQLIEGPPAPVMPPARNGDGGEDADQFTRDMLKRIRADVRKLKGLSAEKKAALTVPRSSVAVPTAAVRNVVADAMSRAATKLAKALERAKATDFGVWLDGFLAEHGPMLSDALEPAAAVLGRADVSGVSLWAAVAVAARRELGPAFETETPAKFGERLAAWPRRVAQKIAGEFDEAEHPRDGDGQFSSGGGDDDDSRDERHDQEDSDIQDQRDSEDSDVAGAREQEDERAAERREAEGDAAQKKRDAEDEAIQEKRGEEDDKQEAQREREDEQREAAREKEDEKREKDRAKEDEREESRRDKEDAKIDKSRDAEDAAIEKRRDKEDGDDGPSDEVTAARDKEDAARDAERDRQDKDREATRDQADKEKEGRRSAEDEAQNMDRYREDRQRNLDREKEDKEIVEGRDREDADRERQREAEDRQRQDRHRQEDRSIQERREREDAEREKQREQEDQDRQKKREQEAMLNGTYTR